MARFNGHRSWNAWNVALWIGNDEPLYRLAKECIHIRKAAREPFDEDGSLSLIAATRRFLEVVGEGSKTPDGATYNFTCVREALAGLE